MISNFTEYNLERTAFETIASKAVQSVLDELVLLPKPGLVTPCSNGAHRDMDVYTFTASASILSFGFYRYLCIGRLTRDEDPLTVRTALRKCGLQIEKEMFIATEGINTHKGVIFLFAFILGAIGRYSDLSYDVQKICAEVSLLSSGICEEDMKDLDKKQTKTHGEKVFLQYGIKGIRGEVEKGLPTAYEAYTVLCENQKEAKRKKYLLALLTIMKNNDDTNIIFRSNPTVLKKFKDRIQSILESSLEDTFLLNQIYDIEEFCRTENISPGGSADILAVSLFFEKMFFCKNKSNK